MGSEPTYRILIGGGGTGGHVFPAIAIADTIRAEYPETEFLFVGAKGKLEMEKVPEAGYAIEGLPVTGFQRRFTLKNITFFYNLAKSMVLSRRIVRRFKPQVAVGVGGYASGPVLKAAAKRGVPILIQEQNSCAGVTNRLLARSAQTICVAYEKMERYFPADRIVLTGNPVRRQLINNRGDRNGDLAMFGLVEGKKTCLVVGGSLGARTINDSLVNGLKKLDLEDLQVLWQCGELYHKEVEEKVKSQGLKNISILPFISKMDSAYRLADLIIARAGALTISELCLAGRPAILIPSPNVAEDHQSRNAEALVSKGAAVMIPDEEARQRMVDTMLELIGNDQKLSQLSENIKKLGIPDASERIAAEVIKLAKNQ